MFRIWLVLALCALSACSTAVAQTNVSTSTGIPIEWLFAILGGLVALIYGDLKREMRHQRHALDMLRQSSERRARTLDRLRIVLSLVCRKLSIPFSGILDENDDDRHSND